MVSKLYLKWFCRQWHHRSLRRCCGIWTKQTLKHIIEIHNFNLNCILYRWKKNYLCPFIFEEKKMYFRFGRLAECSISFWKQSWNWSVSWYMEKWVDMFVLWIIGHSTKSTQWRTISYAVVLKPLFLALDTLIFG